MKKRILFVDEDQNILDSFRAMLHVKRKDWKGSYASCANGGLELLGNEEFDVVVSDLRIPCLDGMEFLDKVRKVQPNAIRVVLSGYSDMQQLLNTTKYAHQFLSKPCSTNVLLDSIQRLLDIDDILNNDEIKNVVVQLKSLPTIPEIYLDVVKELEKAEPDLKLVGGLVEQDIGLSTNLLKVVNSPYFGFYQRVISPAHAVVLLGIDALKGLILGVKLIGSLDPAEEGHYSVGNLWNHCLQTGYFARVIATSEGMDKAFIESCFVCGILHDVGKFVLLTQLYDLYGPLLNETRSAGGPVHSIEQKQLKVSHAEIGAYLLGTWGFSSDIVRGVFEHHAPVVENGEISTALVVHAANVFQHECAVWNPDYSVSPLDPELLAQPDMALKLEKWRELCGRYYDEQQEENGE
ncbi:response regulator [Pseudodesulfovibrio sp. zrk46]|uniref:response regulator n=1 Tax=Pseudodesulfovibrio sp. zrk46 TaxID=2725288 RepID=UPI0014498723|nr:response regulator [Pseudodesulfovibrio sp. zrk46]QJB55917.1 HDOD domain-containing protein [Pseudodesulfovibrio sp. zrk46]